MSIARHHAEWLSLVPVSGPFLSLPVLLEAFNAGLEPHNPDHSRLLRQEYGNWLEAVEKRRGDPAPHQQWIKFVLNGTLSLDDQTLIEGQAIPQTLQVEVLEHHELLRPSLVVVDPGTNTPRMLVKTYPRSQELTSYLGGSPWKASPDTRMTELLHGTGVRLGLVTNGEHWMLVDAPKGETTGYASWYANLWLDEPITLRAFRSLLGSDRFFNVEDDKTLEALLKKSASNQQEVTEQLGYQVRRAVEVLIHSLDKADQDFGRELLAGVASGVLYESALTVMMRLVFLFCAEERELIPSKPFPVYEQNYSVSMISKQLRELADQHGEELLERRFDAWPRLLAAFRAVYGGLEHDDAHIPAYGGSLFDPDRFPFLEGRKAGTNWRDDEAKPLPVNNRTVLHLLESLQLLQIRVPGGGPAEARRVSFRALDIEQIGHVYEGLLDHTAKRATEPHLGLVGTREKEPEIPLAELERLAAKGEADLAKFLKNETGRSETALKKGLKAEIDDGLARLFRTACQGDEALWDRVRPFAGLVRLDSFGYPVVIPQGSVFVTAGTDRRSSGTHYTPRELTEPIVKYTLEPLVYVGPAEGKPKTQWRLKSARELLDLKICDMACGSGAFLVQAARYMAERLLEAWDAAKQANPSTPGITPKGEPSGGLPSETLIPDDPAERVTYAMRIIAQRCLYGVDKNPLAAEMAKLSLWLLTVAKDKPFEFLDHAIRCGDSLVGLHSLDQLRHFSLKPDADDAVLFQGPLDRAVDEAIGLRLKLEDMPANTIEDVERQEKLLKEANFKIARLRCAADLLVAAEFWGESAKDKMERVRHAAVVSGHYVEKEPTGEFEQVAAKERRGQAMFHWPLEFPEVIVRRGGFDAFLGNPPFIGNKYWASALGPQIVGYAKIILGSTVGRCDICALFHRRALSLTSGEACIGLIGCESLREGDTRAVSLDYIAREHTIIRAESSARWPGSASVRVCIIWTCKGKYMGNRVLDGTRVEEIGPLLSSNEIVESPRQIKTSPCSAKGCDNSKGQALLLTPSDEWFQLLKDAKSPYLQLYVTTEDLTDHGFANCCRWAVYCGDESIEEIKTASPETYRFLFEHVQPHRTPELLKSLPGLSNRWWQFNRPGADNYRRIRQYRTCIVLPVVSKFVLPVRVPTNWVFTNKFCIIEEDRSDLLLILHSELFEAYIRQFSGTLDERLSVSQKWALSTFPLPGAAVPNSEEYDSSLVSLEKLHTEHGIGYTNFYNKYHNPDVSAADLQKLRDLHVEIDKAVAAAYGWSNLDLGHGFHETKQGVRFTISGPARREVLQRLLKLNHDRYEEEVEQKRHDKRVASNRASPKKKTSSRTGKVGPGLFDEEDDYA